MEYGSSPPAQGRLSARRGGRLGSSQPLRTGKLSNMDEGEFVAKEPALGDDDFLDQAWNSSPDWLKYCS